MLQLITLYYACKCLLNNNKYIIHNVAVVVNYLQHIKVLSFKHSF